MAVTDSSVVGDKLDALNDENDLNALNISSESIKKLGNDIEEKESEPNSPEKKEEDVKRSLNIHKKKSRRVAVLSSDSEDDEQEFRTEEAEQESASAVNVEEADLPASPKQIRKPKRLAIIDSDSEEEASKSNVPVRSKQLENTESENEMVVTPHNKSFNQGIDGFPVRNESIVYVINKEGKLVPEDKAQQTINKSHLAALCDSESSEEENRREDSPPKIAQQNKRRVRASKKASNKAKPQKEKKMTAKEALQQRQEIWAESQRMLRESCVSLPYHKPKGHTIKEFLEKRPRLSNLLANNSNTPPSVAIKMSMQELEVVNEKLKEREKEVQKFYKSESESDTEDNSHQKSQTPMDDNLNTDVAVDDVNNDRASLSKDQNSNEEVIHNDTDRNTKETDVLCTNSQNETIEQGFSNASNTIETSFEETSANLVEYPVAETENSNLNISELGMDSETQFNIVEDESEDVNYDFNLDGLDEYMENTSNSEAQRANSKEDLDETHLQNLLKKYSSTDEPQPTAAGKLNKEELLKQLATTKPCLRGGPAEEIDLEEGTTKPNQVLQLMERFMRHTSKKNMPKDKVELEVINFSQGEVHRETVAMSIDQEDEVMAISEKPGLKLQKLRNELQSQIAQRRSELWQQKLELRKEGDEDACDDEKKSDYEEDILDDEEEAEITDAESTDEEVLPVDEEDYENLKNYSQSVFIRDEAEEDSNSNEDHEDASRCAIQDDNTTNENDQEDDVRLTASKKPLRRILQAFADDSDDDGDDESSCQIFKPNHNDRINDKSKSDLSGDDEILPVNQPRVDKTPCKEDGTQKPTNLDFLTPVQYLTGLQGFNSETKFLHEESQASQVSLPPEPSPLKDQDWSTNLQKKLFSNSCDALDSPTKLTMAEATNLELSADTEAETQNITTQDMLSICSGAFSGSIENKVMEAAAEDTNTQQQDEECTSWTVHNKDQRTVTQLHLNLNSEVKNLNDEDELISQLLNEEELEEFRKKFESPVAALNISYSDNAVDMEITGGGRIVSDSSDDEDGNIKNKNTKKLQKRLAFSDDENDSDVDEDDQDENDEEIGLCDDLSDEECSNDGAAKVIEYDSEENEIELDDGNHEEMKKLRPSDFFEKEAELSESDWDSADEDEKGLDAWEEEQGDADVFDEKKIRSDLERIHVRQILDSDNREIKMLQELLLEDGELHGTGRKRQFRWRNIDDTENDDKSNINDEEVDNFLEEQECEEQWRKARHKREMFLKSKQAKEMSLDDDVSAENSNNQILRLGQETVRRSLSGTATASNEKPKPAVSSPAVAKPSIFLNTRGSFLARNERFLSKLAQNLANASVTTTTSVAKNTKTLVFQPVDTSPKEEAVTSNKRKADNGSMTNAKKKMRLSSDKAPKTKTASSKKA